MNKCSTSGFRLARLASAKPRCSLAAWRCKLSRLAIFEVHCNWSRSLRKNLAVSFFSVLVAVSACFAQGPGNTAPTKPLTIEAIFAEGGLTGRGPENIKWSPDGSKVSFVQRDDAGDHGELWYVEAATGAKKVLVSEAKLASLAPDATKIKDEREKERVLRYHVAAYLWAPDSKHLLFDSNGQLWLYDLGNGTALQFTSSPDPSEDPKFSPDGNHIAFLRKHNLYVEPISGKDGKQLTDDSDENILNGEVDWVYAEELSVRSNYFWSPDSNQIAFLQMDERPVPTYPITDWLPTHPKADMEKYPKAGDPNPLVKLGVVSAKGGKPKWISLTNDTDIYIPRFGWVREGVLWAQVMNRAQDTIDLYFIDAKSGHSRKVLTESIPDAWVNVNDDFHVLKSGDRFTWSSWRDGNTHLYLYSFDKQNPLANDAKLERQLEKGEYEVLSVEAVDDQCRLLHGEPGRLSPAARVLGEVRRLGLSSPVVRGGRAHREFFRRWQALDGFSLAPGDSHRAGFYAEPPAHAARCGKAAAWRITP